MSSGQKRAFLLCLICLLALVGPLLAGPQADFTNDEGVYQVMARSFALPGRDDVEGLDELLAFYLDRAQAVYVWITEFMENVIRQRQSFNTYDVVPLYQHRLGRFVQLVRLSRKRSSRRSG